MPSMIGTFGPYMSPSSIATRLPRCGERDREIHRHRGLAHAALAGADRDDVLDAVDRLPRRLRPAAARTLAVISMSTAVTPAARATAARRLLAHQILDRTRGRRQLDRERARAAVDREVLHEPERDDVLVEVGILDRAQRVEHGGFGRCAHPSDCSPGALTGPAQSGGGRRREAGGRTPAGRHVEKHQKV